MFLTTFIKVLLILVIVDAIYLYFVGSWAQTMVVKIQRVFSPVRYLSAAIVYLLLAAGLSYFIVEPKKNIWEAAVFGLVVYGVFDFTNMAMFKHYDMMFALTDTLWGAVLSAITVYLAQHKFISGFSI